MNRTTKIILWVVAGLVLLSLANIIWGQIADASVPTPDQGHITKHWCKHHHHGCHHAINHSHYRRLTLDGHHVSRSGKMPASNLFSAPSKSGCEHHELAKQHGGRWGTHPDGVFTDWVQHLTVSWCWKNGSITHHFGHGWIDHVLGWMVRHDSDTHISKWYPWGHRFTPKHNGRFEGIDSTMSLCVGFFGWTCVVQDSPHIHLHEHGDGSYTYTSSRT